MNSTDIKDDSNHKLLKNWGYSTTKNCLIVGALPPPVGGVSTHISRLLPLLNKASVPFEIHNTSTKKKGFNFWGLFCKIITKRFAQIHIHTLSAQLLCAIIAASFISKFEIILYAHNPIFFTDKNYFFKKFLEKLFSRVSQINAVSHLTKETICEVQPSLESKIFVSTFYLPPDINRLKHVKKSYPGSLKKFIQEHHPLVIFNAYRIHFKEGVDVYGLDLSVELLIRLSRNLPGLGMIFALGKRNSSSRYLNSQIDKLIEHGLSSNFYILDGFPNIWSLFDDCNLMIRPTLYDGFSISIKEAILLDCPVVASNSVLRPEECHLFKTRDIDDFEKVALSILKR